MRKKLLLLLPLSLSFLISSLWGGEDFSTLPETFAMNECYSWRMKFEISNESQLLGTVQRKILSWTRQYHLTNAQGELVAIAKMKFWEFVPVFDFVDSNNISLGSCREEISFLPTYTVISPDAKIIAKAKRNFWGTKLSFLDPVDGHELAILSRSFFQWKNDWKGVVKDTSSVGKGGIHPHVFFTLIAFYTERARVLAHREENKGFSLELRSEKPDLQCVRQTLASLRADFEDIDPQEEDFRTIEEMTDSMYEDSEDLQTALSKTFDLFSDDRLSQEQKAALLHMLENRFSVKNDENLEEFIAAQETIPYPSPNGLCRP